MLHGYDHPSNSGNPYDGYHGGHESLFMGGWPSPFMEIARSCVDCDLICWCNPPMPLGVGKIMIVSDSFAKLCKPIENLRICRGFTFWKRGCWVAKSIAGSWRRPWESVRCEIRSATLPHLDGAQAVLHTDKFSCPHFSRMSWCNYSFQAYIVQFFAGHFPMPPP